MPASQPGRLRRACRVDGGANAKGRSVPAMACWSSQAHLPRFVSALLQGVPMAFNVRVQMKNGKYCNIIEEGGTIHVWKPDWIGSSGLGEPFRTFEDALKAAAHDANSEVDHWWFEYGKFGEDEA